MVLAFAEAIQIQEFVYTFPPDALSKLFQCLKSTITRFRDKTDKLDESARIVNLFLKDLNNDILELSLEKYPESNWLRIAAGRVKSTLALTLAKQSVLFECKLQFCCPRTSGLHQNSNKSFV
jgi:hypothetical protein